MRLGRAGSNTLDAGLPPVGGGGHKSLTSERYGCWVPGYDEAMRVEAVMAEYLRGDLTYDEAKAKAANDEEWLIVLFRERGKEDG